jgi:dihydroneopterin aldolase
MHIRLKNIALYAHHGVHEFEKEHGARFEIDVDVTVKDGTGASDRLGDTLDYTELYKTIVRVSTEQKYNLLEAWASYLADCIIKEFSVALAVTLAIRKPGVPIGGPIGSVEIEVTKRRD